MNDFQLLVKTFTGVTLPDNVDVYALQQMGVAELQGAYHLKPSAATKLANFLKVGQVMRSKAARAAVPQVSSSEDAYKLLTDMEAETQEVFKVILMNRRSRVIDIVEIHRGGMAAMIVDPKVVFRLALERRAAAIIVAHNHPSGASAPSIEDIRITDKLRAAGQLLDIQVLDHVIVGHGEYYSFADEGKM